MLHLENSLDHDSQDSDGIQALHGVKSRSKRGESINHLEFSLPVFSVTFTIDIVLLQSDRNFFCRER
jgi:hypothetical protein